MAAPVQTIDFNAVFGEITDRLKAEEEARNTPPLIRLWDGDWNLRGICKQEISANFTFLDNETGTATIEMPADYYLSEWAVDVNERETTNIHVTMDRDGARWDGRLDELQAGKDETGRRTVRLIFKSSMEELHHILAWSNPFLPAEIQFPKVWVLFGRARWALKTTLLCNLIRLEQSLWMLDADPMNPNTPPWSNATQSSWSQVVKPDLTPDNSVPAIIHSRFKTMHEASKKVVADAQLSWEPRRYLDGDPPPWPGANLRQGCLVWDLIDKSAWNTGTSFLGSIFSGLIKEIVNIGGDGITEHTESMADPNFPAEAFQPDFMGSLKQVPAVIYHETEHTGIQTSNFSWKPATDVRVVAGGHSMPGVNELISAAVQMVGDLTAMIPGVPPLGGVADAVLKPLYSDVFLAFGNWHNTSRAQRLGWSHYQEKWADGADRAYTLAWLIAMRTGMWQTREQTRCTITVADGAPWRIGQNGMGHFFIGDRIGFTALGAKRGRIYVERVSEISISWGREEAPVWKIQIGQREAEDPLVRAYEDFQDFIGLLKDLGVG